VHRECRQQNSTYNGPKWKYEKELKRNMYDTVSTLRNMFNKMKVMLEDEIRQKTQTEKKQCNESRTRSLQEG
jgi:hypothetical protein